MAGRRRPCRFTERELARALRAGESAGIPVQVSITRDGSLTVSPISSPQDRPRDNGSCKAARSRSSRALPIGTASGGITSAGAARIASPEFQDAYRKALAGENAPPIEIGSRCSKPGSVAAAVALYLGSIDFGNLADVTRRERRRILDRFREAYGDRPFAGLERKHIEPMMAAKAPHAARSFLKSLRAVVAVALRAGSRDDDPTSGIRIRIRAAEGHRTWTEDDIAQFEAAYPIGSRARLAFALLQGARYGR